MPERKIPDIGSQWRYGNSIPARIYTVVLIANEGFDTNSYPTTVIYLGRNGKVWAKSLTHFTDTMRKELKL